MSFDFSGMPTSIFPSPTTPVAKDLQVKAVKLTFADFTTGGTASVKTYIPADASIVRYSIWTKTIFSGNGVTALTIAGGITGTTTKYLNAPIALPATGAYGVISGSVTNAFQVYDPTAPGGDIPFLVTGTATTGNPTAGEMYLLIEYVR